MGDLSGAGPGVETPSEDSAWDALHERVVISLRPIDPILAVAPPSGGAPGPRSTGS